MLIDNVKENTNISVALIYDLHFKTTFFNDCFCNKTYYWPFVSYDLQLMLKKLLTNNYFDRC